MTASVVLGLGGTLDYESTWSSAVLEDLIAEHRIGRDELTGPAVIASERDLVRSILSFVAIGTGGERFVTDSQIIESLAARLDTRATVGGTCVRAALALDALGVPSTVHLVSIDDHVRRLLPAGVSYICSADEDSTDPHLIVQFPEDALIEAGDIELRAPRANRLIYVHDPANRDMVLSADLPAALRTAELFLVSGFNSMQDAAALDARLDQLAGYLHDLSAEALVVYEDAGFHVPAFSGRVRRRLAGLVDVYSMNEDEMQGHLGRTVDLTDPDSVAAALGELRGVVPARTLVVHTARWAVAVGARAEAYRAALRRGVAAAATRYLHGDGFTEADYSAVRDGPVHTIGATTAGAIEALLPGDACCVPGLDARTDTPTIIGLGDTFVGGFLAALIGDRAVTPGRTGMTRPHVLATNQPPGRFYRGGTRIAAFRGTGPVLPHTPEDWVASTTTLFGENTLGLSRLPGGELLADAVRRDPAGWLGPERVAAFGTDTGLLVKLLDAGQRLPVHAHPDVEFAREHLALGHGKTEAWIFLEPGVVHLGFTRDVGTAELASWVHDQNVEAMLAAMHALQVDRGDAVFVPAGLPHAIGEGCFLVELQEPTDLSILLEWTGFGVDGRRDGHLGLGHETALAAVDRSAWDRTDLEQLRSAYAGHTGDLLPAAAPFFLAERSRGDAVWETGYSVAVVTGGSGVLRFGAEDRLPVRRGDTVVVPFAAGTCHLDGDPEFEVIRCRPSRPRATSS